MSYSILDVTGTSRTLNDQDKITSLDGETKELYVVSIEAEARHRRFNAKRLIDPIDAIIAPFSSLDSSGVPTYGTPYTVKADLHWHEENHFYQISGPDVLYSTGFLVMRHAPNAFKRRMVVMKFTDRQQGKHFAGEYTVSFSSVTYPNQTAMGDLGAPTTSTRTISCDLVELKEGTRTTDGIVLKTGTAMLKVDRSLITRSEVNGRYNYFTISLNGLSVGRFGLDPEQDAAIIENSHHFHIYLKKAVGT